MTRLLPLLVLLLGVLAGPGAAQDTGPHPPAREPAANVTSEAQIDDLLEALRNPDQREDLLRKLEALKAAEGASESAPAEPPAESQEAPKPDAQGAGAGPVPAAPALNLKVKPDSALADADDAVGIVLDEIAGRTEIVRAVAESLANTVDGLPDLVSWVQQQVRDPITREVWIWVGIRVALVLGLATFAHVVVGWAIRGLRRRLVTFEAETMLERLPRMLAWLLLELTPVVAFVITAWIAYNAFALRDLALLVIQPLIEAAVIVRVVAVAAKVVFAHKAPGLRVLPMSDATAHYATRWTRRLGATSVYGYFILMAARRLGMPWELHGILLHVLFLVVTIMVIVVIFQIRGQVERAIARLSEDHHNLVVRRMPWRTLANIWHVPALLYVVSVYVVWALRMEGGFRALAEATVGSAVILVLGWIVWQTIEQVFGGRGAADEEASEPVLTGFEGRANRYRPFAAATLRGLTVAAILVGLLEAWGFGTLTWLLSDRGNTFIQHVLTVFAIILITVMVWEIFSMMVERSVSEQDEEGNPRLSSRARTLLNITRNLVLVFLSLIALFLVLSELGLDVAPLLAGAGVIGLAIGFGSQKLVQDIITGLFMLVGDTIRVGDVAEIAGKAGVIEAVSMRTVTLRDYGGNVHTIPYSAIDVVTNYTKEYSYALFDFPVAYRESVDHVMEVLKQVGAEINRDSHFRRLILEPLEMAGVDKFAESGVIIRCRFKTRPLRQWEVLREFNRRVKNRFDELGIEIPYPHRTLYFGVDKQGNAPPARVDLERPRPSSEVSQTELDLAPPTPSLVARSGN